MIKYNQLKKEEQDKIQQKAKEFLKDHKKTIYKRVRKERNKISPSGSDLFHPELWKESHWRWFLENNFLL